MSRTFSTGTDDVANATNSPKPGIEPVTAWHAALAGWQRFRWLLAVALVIALSALVTAVTVSNSPDRTRLGPDNSAPNGSRALVQVLRQQGVTVRVVSRSPKVAAATDTRSTLVVTNTGLLGPAQLDRLLADNVPHLVLIEPDEITLSRLAPDLRTAGRTPAVVLDPSCTIPGAQAAGRSRAGGYLYTRVSVPIEGPSSSGICYRGSSTSKDGSYLSLDTPRRKVTVIGQSDLLTNQYLGADGNAALALWTLGEQPSLVWYSPDPLEPMNSESGGSGQGGSGPDRVRPTTGELVPEWVFWVLAQLAVATAVAIAWRARRLGRLVSEPLPVIVRAAETQEGRARLYRQASARGRAGATLRTTTLRRLAARLAAPSGTTPDQLITLVATATGRDSGRESALHALLLGPAPESDAALIRLADDLDTVERELSRDRPVRSN